MLVVCSNRDIHCGRRFCWGKCETRSWPSVSGEKSARQYIVLEHSCWTFMIQSVQIGGWKAIIKAEFGALLWYSCYYYKKAWCKWPNSFQLWVGALDEATHGSSRAIQSLAMSCNVWCVEQAVLPLRGKILNIERKDDAAIYKNTELQNLILALGLGVKVRIYMALCFTLCVY